MKTLADIKRRIRPGVRLLCVENTYRPELNGTSRTVVKAQTNAFSWTDDDRGGGISWTYLPKAAGVTIIDADTFELVLGTERIVRGFVRLHFLDEAAT